MELEEGIPVSGKLIDPKTGKAPEGQCSVNAQMTNQRNIGGNGAMVKPDGAWIMYLAPGQYELRYYIQGMNRMAEQTLPLTVEKGKPQNNVTIEIKN